MTTRNPDIDDGLLFLQDIRVELSSNTDYRVQLQVDGDEFPLQRKEESSLWIPRHKIEIPFSCDLTVILKSGHTRLCISFGKLKNVIEIGSHALYDKFGESEQPDNLTLETNFKGQTVTITLNCVQPPGALEVVRTLKQLQGEMRKHRPLMSKAVEQNVDIVLTYALAISEMNSFAKAAVSIVNVSYKLLQEQRRYDETAFELANRLDRILPFAEQALENADPENASLLRNTVGRMFMLTMDVAEFSCGYIQKGRLRKSDKHTDPKSMINELTGRLDKLTEDFDRAMRTEMLASARRIEDKFLIDRLKPVETSHEPRLGCMAGTRKAIINEIIIWAIEENEDTVQPGIESVYWLYSMPGVGKTSVAHSICTQLQEKRRLGGVFFCRRDDPFLNDPMTVLPTLIYKLAETWGPYRRLVAKELHSDPHLNRNTASYGLLSKLLASLQIHPLRPLVLVIDALDECGEPSTRALILKGLFDACSQVSWLKIIVTSRPETDIQSSFEANAGTGRYLKRDLAIDHETTNDIRSFASENFALVAKKWHLSNEWPGDQAVDNIVLRSAGLFIYVKTIWLLVDGKDEDPNEELRYLLRDEKAPNEPSGEGPREPAETSTALYKLYYDVLQSQMSKPSDKFQLAIGAIIVTAEHRPLCDATIARLLGFETHLVQRWVDKLSSLFYREDKGGGIRARHLSIIDFLTGPSYPLEYRVDVPQANSKVGLACLMSGTEAYPDLALRTYVASPILGALVLMSVAILEIKDSRSCLLRLGLVPYLSISTTTLAPSHLSPRSRHTFLHRSLIRYIVPVSSFSILLSLFRDPTVRFDLLVLILSSRSQLLWFPDYGQLFCI